MPIVAPDDANLHGPWSFDFASGLRAAIIGAVETYGSSGSGAPFGTMPLRRRWLDGQLSYWSLNGPDVERAVRFHGATFTAD